MNGMRSEVAAFQARLEDLQLRPQPRDDRRVVEDYPAMPPHTCYISSRVLAECFPELEVRYGRVMFTLRGVPCQFDHAWNVTADGRIVDTTWTPPPDATDVVYGEGRA